MQRHCYFLEKIQKFPLINMLPLQEIQKLKGRAEAGQQAQELCRRLAPRLSRVWIPLRHYFQSFEEKQASSGGKRSKEINGRMFHSGLLKFGLPVNDENLRVLFRAFASSETYPVAFWGDAGRDGVIPIKELKEKVKIMYEVFIKACMKHA